MIIGLSKHGKQICFIKEIFKLTCKTQAVLITEKA